MSVPFDPQWTLIRLLNLRKQLNVNGITYVQDDMKGYSLFGSMQDPFDPEYESTVNRAALTVNSDVRTGERVAAEESTENRSPPAKFDQPSVLPDNDNEADPSRRCKEGSDSHSEAEQNKKLKEKGDKTKRDKSGSAGVEKIERRLDRDE
ncbi:hypothetical protein QFC21_002998 [Naganishia friedmannii]|uniref:Uncharacterized protein n=1 Tax=Naganishia friedmannii TaxID=89922 RepID=A0ACC2VUM2_9TREE|nr:hypothetical protein QFC21_002998 [Naganishia friedmannii]